MTDNTTAETETPDTPPPKYHRLSLELLGAAYLEALARLDEWEDANSAGRTALRQAEALRELAELDNKHLRKNVAHLDDALAQMKADQNDFIALLRAVWSELVDQPDDLTPGAQSALGIIRSSHLAFMLPWLDEVDE